MQGNRNRNRNRDRKRASSRQRSTKSARSFLVWRSIASGKVFHKVEGPSWSYWLGLLPRRNGLEGLQGFLGGGEAVDGALCIAVVDAACGLCVTEICRQTEELMHCLDVAAARLNAPMQRRC